MKEINYILRCVCSYSRDYFLLSLFILQTAQIYVYIPILLFL
jgi:hypothetical protein